MNILFVCSRNQWRSPTAEKIYNNINGINARSAGTASSARIKINTKMINWANIILVMEKKHKKQILEKFPEEASSKKIIVLDIPDIYQYMDNELIEEIKAKVNSSLDL